MALIVPFLCLALAAGDGDFRVETRDGTQVTGQLVALRAGELILDDGGRERRIPGEDLLLLAAQPDSARPDSTPPDPARPEQEAAGAVADEPEELAPDLLVLAGSAGRRDRGDRLWGRLLGGDAFGLTYSVEGSAPFDVPFDHVERLLPRLSRPVDQLIRLEGAGLDDRVWQLLDGGALDGVTGVVDRISSDNVVLDSALGPLGFDVDTLLAVVFGSTEAPDTTLGGLPVVVRLKGGSRMEAGLRDLRDGVVVLQTRFAERLAVPLHAVASMVSRRPGTVLLADLSPTEVVEWPALGTPDDFLFPWRRELSVTGRSLSVSGIPRATGLGVHANARLVFDLPEGTRSLRVSVGLVDEVHELPADASMRFTVLVDGQSRADSGVIREGDPPQVLRVDRLSAGQRLELLADDAGDLDAGDRGAWFDGVILLQEDEP